MAFQCQLLVILGVVFWVAATSKQWRSGESFGPIAPNMHFVVAVDGKSYFAEDASMNWSAAGDYCKTLGMKLGSITSKAQADALENAYDATNFGKTYWTSGRDARENRQFSWDETRQEVPLEYPHFEDWALPYQTCLYYYTRGPGNSHVAPLPCTEVTGMLCEN